MKYKGLTDSMLPKNQKANKQFPGFMGNIPGYNPQKQRISPTPETSSVVSNYMKDMEALRKRPNQAAMNQSTLNRYTQQIRQEDRMRGRGFSSGGIGGSASGNQKQLGMLESDLEEANRAGDTGLAAKIQRQMGVIQNRMQGSSSRQQMASQLRG